MQSKTLLDEYFTPAELAEELDVCEGTLWRWRVEGKGPPLTKVGNKPYYSRHGVIAWLQSREQQSRKRAVA